MESVAPDHGEHHEESQGDVGGDGEVAGEHGLEVIDAGGGDIPVSGDVPELVVPEVSQCDEHHVGIENGHSDVVERDSSKCSLYSIRQ